jgi:ubiquinone/menaquinone biosynthesis C-methylase UbiE
MTTDFFANKQLFFDRWAPFYDFLLTTVIYQAVHNRILDFVRFSTLPIHVLDLGCGTGKLLFRLARTYPELTGVGLDLSPEMIRQAQQANQVQPWRDRVSFLEGNATQLPFADQQFTAVFSSISFLHYPDPEAVFQEVARVLQPGGKFYWADYTRREARPGDFIVPISPGGLRLYSPKQRTELGRQTGLRVVNHHYLINRVLLTIFESAIA